jgi:hypothetical protein
MQEYYIEMDNDLPPPPAFPKSFPLPYLFPLWLNVKYGVETP